MACDNLKQIKTIYYRGNIRSCNYSCSYCPFRSLSGSADADEAALTRFCGRVRELGDGLVIMFVPSGEALIHGCYQKAMASLCKYDNVNTVGCQTNLSFDVNEFLTRIEGCNAKISLWCTFHPSQTTLRDFLGQCGILKEHDIPFCVGAVGDPKNIPVLQELRGKLPSDTYMWINAIKARPPKVYSPGEVEAFTAIDPLFKLELTDFAAEPKSCAGGKENIFVSGGGDYFSCNISKARLGNLYSEENIETLKTCRSKKCDCYLAYSNRNEMRDIFLSKESCAVRNPSTKRAVFFDVDGTLTDHTGKIPKKNILAVKELSSRNLIFLATSLPFEYAKETCKDIWRYLSGGAFAEGSDTRIFDCAFKKIEPLSAAAVEMLSPGVEYESYYEDGILHKVTVLSGHVPDSADFNIVPGDVTGIVSKNADKLSGVLSICEKLKLLSDNVTVMGNSANDIPMLRFFKNSMAVPDSDEPVKNSAGSICGPSMLIF
jgi:3-deoxy-D-manno-octulosonate 8-phosphate phosphatase KdsC-like HAD superfamily phosphatase